MKSIKNEGCKSNNTSSHPSFFSKLKTCETADAVSTRFHYYSDYS